MRSGNYIRPFPIRPSFISRQFASHFHWAKQQLHHQSPILLLQASVEPASTAHAFDLNRLSLDSLRSPPRHCPNLSFVDRQLGTLGSLPKQRLSSMTTATMDSPHLTKTNRRLSMRQQLKSMVKGSNWTGLVKHKADALRSTAGSPTIAELPAGYDFLTNGLPSTNRKPARERKRQERQKAVRLDNQRNSLYTLQIEEPNLDDLRMSFDQGDDRWSVANPATTQKELAVGPGPAEKEVVDVGESRTRISRTDVGRSLKRHSGIIRDLAASIFPWSSLLPLLTPSNRSITTARSYRATRWERILHSTLTRRLYSP